MKVLVTGGAGFIGSHVAELMLAQGYNVSVVDNLSSGRLRNLPPGVDFRKHDIRSEDFGKLIQEIQPEAIFHLAAQIDVRHSVTDPVQDAEINILGTIRLLQSASAYGCKKVIFSSTGGAIYGEQDAFPAPESHPSRPVSPYGNSKFCAETYLAYFQRATGLQTVALRYSNVYGPRQDPHGEAGVVAIFAQKMLSKAAPTIFGDGLQTRDFVFAQDVARANLLALQLTGSGTFNIGTGIETDVRTLYQLMAGHAGFKDKPIFAPERPGEQKRSVIDPTQAEKCLGWRPSKSLSEGLLETIHFFRQTTEY